jgi:hypothetical protein
MRSRRSVLALGAGLGLAGIAGKTAFAGRPPSHGVSAIKVDAYPISRLSIGGVERSRPTGLVFRSGLELRSSFDGFGGFSGLSRSKDGRKLVGLTDAGQWLTADLSVDEMGHIKALQNVVMAPLLNAQGVPLPKTRSYDTESLTIDDGLAYVGIERSQEVMRFDFAKDGVMARGVNLPVPKALKSLPSNKGPEAIAIAPPASPLAGAMIVISERARWERDAPTIGFILTGPRQGQFDVARPNNYEVTDGAFLENGDLLLLERHFSLFTGVRCRIRRIKGDTIRVGALLDGDILFEADSGDQIDNMEGISIHKNPRGETIITLISDDNFSVLQRTLILELVLKE